MAGPITQIDSAIKRFNEDFNISQFTEQIVKIAENDHYSKVVVKKLVKVIADQMKQDRDKNQLINRIEDELTTAKVEIHRQQSSIDMKDKEIDDNIRTIARKDVTIAERDRTIDELTIRNNNVEGNIRITRGQFSSRVNLLTVPARETDIIDIERSSTRGRLPYRGTANLLSVPATNIRASSLENVNLNSHVPELPLRRVRSVPRFRNNCGCKKNATIVNFTCVQCACVQDGRPCSDVCLCSKQLFEYCNNPYGNPALQLDFEE